jgi:hypothetical protein
MERGQYPKSHKDGLTIRTKEEQYPEPRELEEAMPADPESQSTAEPDRHAVATDQAIATCGGDVCAALKAMIVANEFLESEACELMQAVSHAYARGRFKPYNG